MADKDDIDIFVKDFRDQLAMTCRIHHCKVSDISDHLWGITLSAARNVNAKRTIGAKVTHADQSTVSHITRKSN